MNDTPTTSKLICSAPHPDHDRKGFACGGFLGYAPSNLEFVGLATSAPHHSDGNVWLRCQRTGCRLWNKFKLPARKAA